SKVETTGTIGLLESSPPFDLPPGHYRARWYGRARATGRVRADVVEGSGAGVKKLAEERVDVVPGEAQVLLASVDAVLESATQGVEFRLFVESPGPMTLEQVLFDQIW